jgi:ArsR family transcriptional regulator, lead/cadmium/zinc/bismuth-responsive transcriptional repressor
VNDDLAGATATRFTTIVALSATTDAFVADFAAFVANFAAFVATSAAIVARNVGLLQTKATLLTIIAAFVTTIAALTTHFAALIESRSRKHETTAEGGQTNDELLATNDEARETNDEIQETNDERIDLPSLFHEEKTAIVATTTRPSARCGHFISCSIDGGPNGRGRRHPALRIPGGWSYNMQTSCMSNNSKPSSLPACEPTEHDARAPVGPRVSDEAYERAASFFRAAGDVARLKLLTRLADGGEWCVTELAQAAHVPLPTISQQLRLLRTEGMVSRRRVGKHVYYALADAHIRDLLRSALDHAAEGPPAPDED